MAVCGSCGMMVDGEPKLTCKEPLSDYGDTVEVAPLANFPIVRDLVVDIDGFMDKFKSVKPWIIRAKERAVEEGPMRQSPEELEDFKQFSMCINCMLCYAACPVVANEPEFLGPAAIALGHRYNLDSRDEGASERNEVFRGEGTVFSCSFAERVQPGLPEARRSGGGRESGEVQRGDRLGAGTDPAARRREVAMSRPAHPHAMQPEAPGAHAHRAAAAAREFPFAGRYRAYTLFDWTGLVYLLLGFLALEVVWALGYGARPGMRSCCASRSPFYIAFHVLASSSVVFVGVRFFGFFPKAQPPHIGPLKPPPQPVILAGALRARGSASRSCFASSWRECSR